MRGFFPVRRGLRFGAASGESHQAHGGVCGVRAGGGVLSPHGKERDGQADRWARVLHAGLQTALCHGCGVTLPKKERKKWRSEQESDPGWAGHHVRGLVPGVPLGDDATAVPGDGHGRGKRWQTSLAAATTAHMRPTLTLTLHWDPSIYHTHPHVQRQNLLLTV